MLSLLLTAAIVQDPGRFEVFLGDPAEPTTRLRYLMWENKLANPKLSPKKFGDPPQPFLFEWLVVGEARPHDAFVPRFLIYSQERRASGDKAGLVARQLLRQWEFNYSALGLEHKELYANRTVHVYLCWGGSPGGEQLYDTDLVETPNKTQVEVKVNTIYIYDLPSFKDPVEMAREVAHEYGHASLPPVGGFKTPEDWGNGYLGEKLYLRYLRNQMKAGKLQPADAMGATLDQLDKWVKKNADPLEKQVATQGVEVGLLDGEGEGSINHYVGLNLLMQTILPPKVYRAALFDTASTAAKDLPAAFVRTIENSGTSTVLSIPTEYKKGLWIPVGKCRVAGATVEKRRGDWHYVVPGASVVTLVPPKQ